MIVKTRDLALEYMEKNGYGGHDKLHILRVEKLARELMRGIRLDPIVLFNAVWFHDTGRLEELKTGEDHAIISAKIAYDLLTNVDGFPREKIGPIGDCIKAHRYRNGVKPFSVEARILQDADRLDALGMTGIYRVFTHDSSRALYKVADPFCESGRELDDSKYILDHFYEKLFRLESLNTKKARELAKERIRFMKLALDQLKMEVNGEV
ncbi:HD domain-containing protein [Candidatus Woesearchaeota archaeon]|nr:HD domain-containing protein [Candidatus Woesearchaeota archaeon]